jgi:hypothetical protein
MTQEVAAKPAETPAVPEKKPVAAQDLIDSLRSISDDIGQISELTSEEKLLVSQFFSSFLALMRPLATALPVSVSAFPEIGLVNQAFVDPTGKLMLIFQDGHMELRNLEEDQNRELMISVIEDVMPKFKSLTSGKKRKLESRIKFLTSITKELQKISDALSSVISKPS